MDSGGSSGGADLGALVEAAEEGDRLAHHRRGRPSPGRPSRFHGKPKPGSDHPRETPPLARIPDAPGPVPLRRPRAGADGSRGGGEGLDTPQGSARVLPGHRNRARAPRGRTRATGGAGVCRVLGWLRPARRIPTAPARRALPRPDEGRPSRIRGLPEGRRWPSTPAARPDARARRGPRASIATSGRPSEDPAAPTVAPAVRPRSRATPDGPWVGPRAAARYEPRPPVPVSPQGRGPGAVTQKPRRRAAPGDPRLGGLTRPSSMLVTAARAPVSR